MLAYWRKLLSRIDALEPRRRGLLLFGLVVLSYALWDNLLMKPLDARAKALSGQVSGLRGEIGALHAQVHQLAQRRGRDPDAGVKKKLEALRRDGREVAGRLQNLTAHLAPAEHMAEVLESVLTQDSNLVLVSLEGMGATPVLAPDKKEPGAVKADDNGQGGENGIHLYRHGLRMVFRGGYLDTLDYLRALEELPWRFFWDKVAIQVKEHPTAIVTLEVFTLSMEKGWIGI